MALARRELEPGTELEGAGRQRDRARHRASRPQARPQPTSPRASRCSSTGSRSGSPPRRSPPASTSTSTTCARCRARGSRCRRRSEGGAAAAPPERRRRATPRSAGRTRRPTIPTFDGIVRPDGRVGTRNYVAVLSSVNCSATVVKRIAAAFSAPGALDDHPGVDGVIAITHGSGCGLSRDGEGLEVLRRTLSRLRPPSQRGRRRRRGARLRGQPDLRARRRLRPPGGHAPAPPGHPGARRIGGDRAPRSGARHRAPARGRRAAPAGARVRARARAQLRRLGRLVGGHRQPRARGRGRPPGRRRRHRDPRRDARDPRRRAPAHQPRRVTGGGATR